MNHPALPVRIDVNDPDLHRAVTSFVEQELGWQPITGTALPPRLALADTVCGDVPTVVVTTDRPLGTIPEALATIDWPDGADLLKRLTIPEPPQSRRQVVNVVGAGKGVGTTTVTLALGALMSWQYGSCVVITDQVGCQNAGVSSGGEVEGVTGLLVHDRDVFANTPAADVEVTDNDRSAPPDVIVGRGDRQLWQTLQTHRDVPVITCGLGGMYPHEVAKLVGDRSHVHLPWSFRVARAALRSQIPVGLPGRYMKTLVTVLDAVSLPLVQNASASLQAVT